MDYRSRNSANTNNQADRLRRDKENLFSNGRGSSPQRPSYNGASHHGQQHQHQQYRNASPSRSGGSRGSNPYDQRNGGEADNRRFNDGRGYEGGGGSPWSTADGGSRAMNPYDDRRENGVTADNATEEDVLYVQSQIRNTKQQSLQSTRNMMRMVNETEATASKTLNQLGTQSEMLNNIENRMDISQIHAESAAEKSARLKSLNRSIFAPNFKNPFTKKKRAEAEIAKAEAEHLETQRRRDNLRVKQEETRTRIQNGRGGGGGGNKESYSGYSNGSGGRSHHDPSAYSRYQHEADEDDHEMEREIASNLDGVSDMVGRLKGMALTMHSEIQQQNSGLERLSGKVDTTGATIAGSSARLRSIK